MTLPGFSTFAVQVRTSPADAGRRYETFISVLATVTRRSAVMVTAAQLHADTHRPGLWVGEVIRALTKVGLPKPLRHEDFEGLPDQVGMGITKQAFDRRVGQDDQSIAIDDQHRLGG